MRVIIGEQKELVHIAPIPMTCWIVACRNEDFQHGTHHWLYFRTGAARLVLNAHVRIKKGLSAGNLLGEEEALLVFQGAGTIWLNETHIAGSRSADQGFHRYETEEAVYSAYCKLSLLRGTSLLLTFIAPPFGHNFPDL